MPSLSAVPVTSIATKRKSAPKEDETGSDDSDSDVSMIDVDFDFYNLNADVDLMAVKRFLRQDLSYDDQMVDVHPLAELILSEGVRLGAGSSIKTDGEESDPWGLVAVVDVTRNKDHPALKPLLEYLISALPPSSPLLSSLQPISSNYPALVFSLRMLNLPLPLVPPLYRMLLSELEIAESNGTSPRFTDFVIWGRGYRLESAEGITGLEMDDDNSGRKKTKGGKGSRSLEAGSFPYHSEEEFFDQVGKLHTYPLKTAPPRDSESFGVDQYGRLVKVSRDQLAKAVEAMIEASK